MARESVRGPRKKKEYKGREPVGPRKETSGSLADLEGMDPNALREEAQRQGIYSGNSKNYKGEDQRAGGGRKGRTTPGVTEQSGPGVNPPWATHRSGEPGYMKYGGMIGEPTWTPDPGHPQGGYYVGTWDRPSNEGGPQTIRLDDYGNPVYTPRPFGPGGPGTDHDAAKSRLDAKQERLFASAQGGNADDMAIVRGHDGRSQAYDAWVKSQGGGAGATTPTDQPRGGEYAATRGDAPEYPPVFDGNPITGEQNAMQFLGFNPNGTVKWGGSGQKPWDQYQGDDRHNARMIAQNNTMDLGWKSDWINRNAHRPEFRQQFHDRVNQWQQNYRDRGGQTGQNYDYGGDYFAGHNAPRDPGAPATPNPLAATAADGAQNQYLTLDNGMRYTPEGNRDMWNSMQEGADPREFATWGGGSPGHDPSMPVLFQGPQQNWYTYGRTASGGGSPTFMPGGVGYGNATNSFGSLHNWGTDLNFAGRDAMAIEGVKPNDQGGTTHVNDTPYANTPTGAAAGAAQPGAAYRQNFTPAPQGGGVAAADASGVTLTNPAAAAGINAPAPTQPTFQTANSFQQYRQQQQPQSGSGTMAGGPQAGQQPAQSGGMQDQQPTQGQDPTRPNVMPIGWRPNQTTNVYSQRR